MEHSSTSFSHIEDSPDEMAFIDMDQTNRNPNEGNETITFTYDNHMQHMEQESTEELLRPPLEEEFSAFE